MKIFSALAMIAAFGLTGSAAMAQVSSQGGPYAVGSDSWHADGKTHTQYFDGRVEVTQADSRLRADHIKITFAGTGDSTTNDGWGDILSIDATGNVYYVTPNETIRGDEAVYSKPEDTMTITGEVVMQQGQNVMTGNRLVAQIGAGQTSFDSAPGGKNNGRVKGVFYPDSKSAQKAANAGN